MAAGTTNSLDQHVRDAVLQQLDSDPQVDASGIGVTARDGAVTLSGFIDTYEGKLAAERAAKRIRGVRAVANDIVVRVRHARTDDEIARDAARALGMRESIPHTVQAAVHSGHVTLTGTVSWLFQREAAEKAVRFIPGVTGIINHVAVRAASTPTDIRKRITETLHRMADVDAHHISVALDGSVVTLEGDVSSWSERDAAAVAAAIEPGVTRVENNLRIKPHSA